MEASPIRQVLVQVGSGLILLSIGSAVGGITYLSVVVPRSLDQVLQNQRVAGDRLLRAEQRITVVEGDVRTLGNRTMRLELKR